MNPYYFSSYLKKSSEENFKETLSKVRISHAVPLLLSTGLKTYEIDCRVGFGDARSFSDAFQRLYRETPSAFRRRAAQEKAPPKCKQKRNFAKTPLTTSPPAVLSLAAKVSRNKRSASYE